MSKVGELNIHNNFGQGHIKTLKTDVKFELHENQNKQSSESPDYNIIGEGGVELGGAWKRTAQNGPNRGMSFLSLTLDDPSFNAAINVSAFVREDGENFDIVWTRPKAKAA
ncbi:DUF736 domain-containing protein [Pseudemcibacter aquimaris]|uniref:DUF736 domain-containing protein n=1 Tax=Pseudemcibacter aquimaris TaxID=2857064 RepID=UPI002010D62D|nr:DUF736 domain-containing protein [Pseudemcibacter aquimaris]MCC3859763.1 DUF736 domain-containing protein [Pseudemcibacter aquimaris]WDU60157.1 DUF736 domain-containing protein [Pseudemcibacter aquimaris]